MNRKQPFDRPMVYRIRIKGHLDEHWSEWLEGLTITPEATGETLLCGLVPDQAALYGLLKKVRDMGLGLIAVSRVACDLQQTGTKAAEKGDICIHCRRKQSRHARSNKGGLRT